jgi:hypothetical protein
MKGIYWRTITFKKSVIYLKKVNYKSYNYTPCNSTLTCHNYIKEVGAFMDCPLCCGQYLR